MHLTLILLFSLDLWAIAIASPITLQTPPHLAPGSLTVQDGCTAYHQVHRHTTCADILREWPGLEMGHLAYVLNVG